jgi:hypothetical protein
MASPAKSREKIGPFAIETGFVRRNSAKAIGTPRDATVGASSPSVTIISPNAAPHSRIAFSSIASNTGARSPGEELITPNTSAVAICCSSASSRSAL